MTRSRSMLFRFSLYGFLKNQQYYEPFIVLAFLEKGLSFFLIGLLVGFREISIALLEIPSGAVADLYGRRRCMILSFCAYIVSFLIFALADQLFLLFGAMFFFAVGDAFRTGTHKAMIFDWLRCQGREGERTKVYGFTRSWSKMGSAVSALVAAAFVFVSGRYSSVFWLCILPYAVNIVNFMGYPSYLDGESRSRASLKGAFRLSSQALTMAVTEPRLRRLFVESMLLEGVFKVTKDYLQPVLRSLALMIPAFWVLSSGVESLESETHRSAVVIGVVFALNFALMSWASRQSHRAATRVGGEEPLTRLLWKVNVLVFAAMAVLLLLDSKLGAVLCFMGAGAIQNLFRPAQISRFDDCSSHEIGATVLSVESQAKAVAAAFMAPLVGFAVDHLVRADAGSVAGFWPVAVLGAGASLAVVLATRRRSRPSDNA